MINNNNFSKKYLFFLLGAFAFLLSISMVAAANTVTLNYPAASAEGLSGTIPINATLDTNSNILTNATFYYRIDNGGTPTAWVTIGSQVLNVSVNQTEWNTTFDTTGIVDTINMTFNATITNATGGAATSDSSINVSIDNGNPTATWSSASLATNTNTDPSQSFTIGVDADNTIGIESCVVWFDTTSATITATNEACSASYTCGSFAVAANHNPTFKVQVIDDNGDKTNTTSRTTTCRGTGGGYSTVDQVTVDPNKAILKNTQDLTVSKDNFIIKFFKSIANWFSNLF